jgi:hypothetical protein
MVRGEEEDVMISWRRPGVPIKIVGVEDLRFAISSLTEEVPPMSRLAESNEVSSLGNTARKPCNTEYI